AARIKRTPLLYQEATQTITTPSVTLLHQFPYALASTPVFSPDSKLLAFHTGYSEKGEPLKSSFGAEPFVVREMTSGKLLASTECDAFAFSPTGQPHEPTTSPSVAFPSDLIGVPSDPSPQPQVVFTVPPHPHKPLLALSKVTHETVTRLREDGVPLTGSTGIKEQVVRLWDPITRKEV